MSTPKKQSGQTLIALLIFMLLAILLTTAAATITIITMRTGNAAQYGEQALAYAESGAEAALHQLLLDPAYSGDAMAFSSGTATISVSGSAGVKTIVSKGTSNNATRTITVTADYTNNILVLTSWDETD